MGRRVHGRRNDDPTWVKVKTYFKKGQQLTVSVTTALLQNIASRPRRKAFLKQSNKDRKTFTKSNRQRTVTNPSKLAIMQMDEWKQTFSYDHLIQIKVL